MAQNQNPGLGNAPQPPMRGNMGNLAGLLSAAGGNMGAGRPQPMQGPTPATMAGNAGLRNIGMPQGAPGQGAGGAKGQMQQQIAGLRGGPPGLGGQMPQVGGMRPMPQNMGAPPGAQQQNLASLMRRAQGGMPQGAPGAGVAGQKAGMRPQMQQQIAQLPGGPR
jgi:hypothetical protein